MRTSGRVEVVLDRSARSLSSSAASQMRLAQGGEGHVPAEKVALSGQERIGRVGAMLEDDLIGNTFQHQRQFVPKLPIN